MVLIPPGTQDRFSVSVNVLELLMIQKFITTENIKITF